MRSSAMPYSVQHDMYWLFSTIRVEAQDCAMAGANGLAELRPVGPNS
jgi:hypothetical protein